MSLLIKKDELVERLKKNGALDELEKKDNIEIVDENDKKDGVENNLVVYHQKGNNIGRGAGTPNTPNFIRELAGVSASMFGLNPTMESFGISKDSASSYKNGKTSVNKSNGSSPELDKKVKEVNSDIEDRIFRRTSNKISKLINSIEDKDIKEIDGVVKKSIVARNLAAVADKFNRGKDERSGDKSVYHIYIPDKRKLESFDVIEVKPKVLE